MKKLLFFLLIIIPLSVMAQDYDAERDSLGSNTKYGVLLMQKGIFVKYEDFKVQKYSCDFDGYPRKVKVSIRKFYGVNKNNYFINLRIGTASVYIAYSDLMEINKAIKKLRFEASEDCLKQPEYIKNQFITDDNLVIGYWVEKKLGKYPPIWFLDFNRLNRYMPIFKNIDIVEFTKIFQEKQAEIEDMMVNDK